MALIDLTGQVFSGWTVIEQDKKMSRQKNRAYWVCKCECGTVKSVRGESLRKGTSTSCGCKKIKDLKGQFFGYVEVLERDLSIHERDAYWICKCHGCGKVYSINSHDLQANQSCGCKKYDIVSEKISAHLEGQTFNYLTVLERDTSKPKGFDAYWICKCNNCGNTCSVRTSDLKNNKIKSCGCLNSKGEATLNLLFQKMNIRYINQYKFDDLYGDKGKLKFDYYLPDYNLLIEYQGEQHYLPQKHFGGEEKFEQQKRYDELKQNYCKEHEYKLIEIPYWNYGKLNEEYIQNLLKGELNA